MSSRTTIKDIAAKLGVTPKTVSIALNGGREVGETLREHIISTAREMNYVPNRAAKALSRGEISITAIVPAEPAEYYAFVSEGLNSARAELADLHCSVTCLRYSSVNAHAEVAGLLADILREAEQGHKPDGIVLANSYDDSGYISALERLCSLGVVIFFTTLLSSGGFAADGSVSLDTALTGRMAAEFLAASIRQPSRRVAIMTSNAASPVHRECIASFRTEAAKYGLDLRACIDTFEDKRTAHDAAARLTRELPDLGGIYITSYNSVGVCDALEELGLARRVAVVGHDLCPDIIGKLRAGTLNASLFQNQYRYGYDSLLCLYEFLTGSREVGRCVKTYAPQLVLRCMADNFPHYSAVPKIC